MLGGSQGRLAGTWSKSRQYGRWSPAGQQGQGHRGGNWEGLGCWAWPSEQRESQKWKLGRLVTHPLGLWPGEG